MGFHQQLNAALNSVIPEAKGLRPAIIRLRPLRPKWAQDDEEHYEEMVAAGEVNTEERTIRADHYRIIKPISEAAECTLVLVGIGPSKIIGKGGSSKFSHQFPDFCKTHWDTDDEPEGNGHSHYRTDPHCEHCASSPEVDPHHRVRITTSRFKTILTINAANVLSITDVV